MKTFKKLLALGVVVMPMLTSCYDDTSVWDKFDEIENRLEAIELSLNEQIQALSTIIDGKITVSSYEKNSDGSYKVTLSNGSKFTVLPDGTNYSALVSVITVNGVKCWATYDASGKLIALTDDAGQPVPVVNDYRTQVEVVVEDGAYYLVIDGKKYMTGYDTKDLVQVFSSCEQLKDASGNVYAMTFTFGDGVKVTVAVDGYNGVIFKLPSMVSSEVVTEYFVSNSDTQSLLLDMVGVIDYIMQIPDGWRIAERTDEYSGDKYIDITAPSTEAIAAGAAVAKGELKVVSVVEGGKAAVSKVMLSSDPFKTFEVNGTKAVLVPYVGVQKFVYGITLKSEYNEATLINTVNTILKTTGSIPAGYVMSENAIDAEHQETYGKNLTNNAEYVFWAIPALYSEGENGGFYVKEGTFKTYEFSNVSVRFNKVTASLLDAELNITFNGVNKIYAGVTEKTSDALSEIIRLINYEVYTPVEVNSTYNGPASAFPTASNENDEISYGKEYICWIVPYQEGKTTYTTNDLIYTEFKTKSLTSGSSLEVALGEATLSRTSIKVPLSSQGAKMIFYCYMTKDDGERIERVDNDTKAEIIQENASCVVVKGDKTDALVEKVYPNTAMYLYTFAVDNNGKYGKVSHASYTTEKLDYNSLTVTAKDLEVSSESATFQIEVSGGEAVEYVYWFGKGTDDFWLNVKYLGGNQVTASQYLALYPNDENIVKSMNKYGPVGSDGILKVNDLAKSSEYILVVSAKDKEGRYSSCAYKMVVTLAANLGTIVREGSAEWNKAKESLKFDWIKEKFHKKASSQGFSNYAFNFTCPTEYTAFIVCGNEDYYKSSFSAVEDVILEIKDYACKRVDHDYVPTDAAGEYLIEPNWYDNSGKARSGQLMCVYNFYVHGDPNEGYVTYLGSEHNSNSCPTWVGGSCENYEIQKQKLAKYVTIEHWIERFRNSWGVTNEESLQKSAQAYLEAYMPFYKDADPKLYVNTGTSLYVNAPYASGPDDAGNVLDDVAVVLVDANGNYYEPMYIEVPDYFN